MRIGREPRTWQHGDPAPLLKVPVTDKLGRLWHWDHELMFWIHELTNGTIEASAPTFEDLLARWGPVTER
jgi:hypothetical protein